VVDGSTGFLVPCGEVDMLARRSEELLLCPVLRVYMASRSWDFVAAHFVSSHVQDVHAEDILASIGR